MRNTDFETQNLVLQKFPQAKQGSLQGVRSDICASKARLQLFVF